MSDAAVDPVIEGPKGRRFSLVWLFPLATVAVALFLLWQEYSARGPVIEIAFRDGQGLVAGETELRYRSVAVGRVEDLRFSEDLKKVLASVRIQPEVAPFVDEDASFWVVSPEVSARGITGLETVLSGVYIEASWNGDAEGLKRKFDALSEPPLTPRGTPGRRVKLRASETGSLSVGAPILYRGVEVGRVEAQSLTEDGTSVEFDLFVAAPNDKRLTIDTRFWNVSGVDLSFGADGARLRIATIASLLQGGASFEDLSGGAAEQAPEGYVYDLYPSEADARAQALDVEPGERLLLDVYFDGSVRGLSVGAPVEYQGIPVGRVTSVAAEVDPTEGLFSTRTTIAVSPRRLGLEEGDIDGALAFFDKAVARGVRAQLATANLLTGALLVRLVNEAFPPGAGVARIERREGRPPQMPATQTDLDELAGSVEGALKRIDRLPIEELLSNAVLVLENVNAIIGSEAARKAPDSLLSSLESLDALLASQGVQGAPDEALALLKAMRGVAESEELSSATADFAALMASARIVAASLEESDLAGTGAAALTALRERLEDPELVRLAASVAAASDAAASLLATPALQETPEAMNAALASLRAMLDAPGLKEAPEELTGALVAARSLLETLEHENTAGEIAAAAAAARALAEDPALRRLADEAAGAAAALRAVLGSDTAGDLPQAAADALKSATAVLDQLKEAGLADQAAKTLASIDSASKTVTASLSAAPAMLRDLGAAARRADGLLASFEVGSELNYEAITAIREIRDAARAITDLAALLEQRPNSLILGR